MIEITRDTKYIYCLDPDNPRIVRRKQNKHRAHLDKTWRQIFLSEEAARRAIVHYKFEDAESE